MWLLVERIAIFKEWSLRVSAANGGIYLVSQGHIFSPSGHFMTERLLLILSLSLVVVCLLPDEKTSLLALHDATSGPSWKNNWDRSLDPCSWFGVVCNLSNSSVEILSLPSNNLIGSLPDLELPFLIKL